MSARKSGTSSATYLERFMSRSARMISCCSDSLALDAIAARFRGGIRRPVEQANRLSAAERKALNELGLDESADRRAIRRAYSERVRRYHPDRNGGDRSHEGRLQKVIAAYQQLRQAPAFA